jgi:hypothetical protein
MKRRAFLVALVATLAATRPAAANSNKLVNSVLYPDFHGWTLLQDPRYTISWIANQGKYEPGAMLVTATGTAPAHNVIARQVVNVSAGTWYSIGTWFWYSGDSATVPMGSVSFAWYDGLGGTGDIVANDVSAFSATDKPGVWQIVYKVAQAPPGAKSLLLYLDFTTSESKGALAMFDDPFVSGGVIGDVNGDGAYGVDDVFYLVNYLFGNGPLPIGPSDVNQDYVVDVSDVFYLINFLFSGGNPPSE